MSGKCGKKIKENGEKTEKIRKIVQKIGKNKECSMEDRDKNKRPYAIQRNFIPPLSSVAIAAT